MRNMDKSEAQKGDSRDDFIDWILAIDLEYVQCKLELQKISQQTIQGLGQKEVHEKRLA